MNTTKDDNYLYLKLETQIENALLNKHSKNKNYLGKVNIKVSKQINSLLGINVNQRNHILLDNDIRHMLNNHGNKKRENSKNQIAITKEDIKNIPQIINNPDLIIKGSPNKEGASIRYIKTLSNAITYIVEIVPQKSKYLKIKTMWKEPTTVTHASNKI